MSCKKNDIAIIYLLMIYLNFNVLNQIFSVHFRGFLSKNQNIFNLVQTYLSFMFRFLFRSQSRKLVFLSILTLCLTQPPTPGNLILVHSLSFPIPAPPPPLSPSGPLFYICALNSGNEWNPTWKRRKKCFLRKAK